MNAAAVRWLWRGTQLAALGWVAYTLATWLVPGWICFLGSGRHCADAAIDALDQKPPNADALRFSARGCDLGNTTACNALGICYQLGAGTAKDFVRASQQYRKACDIGSSFACYNYAHLPDEEKLPPLPESEQLRAYGRSCELKLGAGCRRLISLSKDRGKSLEFARKGCALEDAPSCAAKAVLLASTQPKSEEAHQSVVELTALCSESDATACGVLGMLYGAGATVARDVPRAKELMGRACRRGNKSACDMQNDGAMLAKLPELLPLIVEKISRSEVGP